MALTIEILSPENFKEAAQLSVELWPECEASVQSEYYMEMIGSASATCYLVKHDGRYIGFIELSLRTDHVEGSDLTCTPYIEGVYVKREHRHKGTGLRLIQAAEEWALSHGYRQIASDVEIYNEASINFHTAAGFKEANRLVCFIKDISPG